MDRVLIGRGAVERKWIGADCWEELRRRRRHSQLRQVRGGHERRNIERLQQQLLAVVTSH